MRILGSYAQVDTILFTHSLESPSIVSISIFNNTPSLEIKTLQTSCSTKPCMFVSALRDRNRVT